MLPTEKEYLELRDIAWNLRKQLDEAMKILLAIRDADPYYLANDIEALVMQNERALDEIARIGKEHGR